MTRYRVLSVLLCTVLMGVCIMGCNTTKSPASSAVEAPSSSTREDDASWVDSLPLDESQEPSEPFDNTGSSDSAGESSEAGGFENTSSGTKPGPTASKEPEEPYDPTAEFGVSAAADDAALAFHYDGMNYRYAITQDKQEVLAYRDAGGKLVDMLAGAGEYILRSPDKRTVLTAGAIRDFHTSVEKNRTALTVTYDALGDNEEKATIRTTYIFYDNNVTMNCFIGYESGGAVLSPTYSQLSRRFLNSFTSCDTRLNDKWVYPSDGDWPYKEFDGIATIHDVGSRYQIFTLLTDNGTKKFTLEEYPETALPMTFEQGKGVYYTLSYSVSFADKARQKNTDCRSLFNAKDSSFATRVTPVKPNADNTTLFVGDSTSFNINVTNLTDGDLTFSLRYEIRDYYGNILEAKVFLNSKVFKGLDANRIVKVAPGKYGIFFINLAVTSKDSAGKGSSYREMLSFALLKPHTFKDNASSPFGISGIPAGERYSAENQLSIMRKLGVANTRMSIEPVVFQNNKEYNLAAAKTYKDAGIVLNGMNLYWQQPTDPVAYERITEESVKLFAPYLDSCEVGNEDNLPVLNGVMDLNTAFQKFKDNVFTPGYNVLSKAKIPYILAANAGCDSKWDDTVYQNGLWNKFDILSIHPYGYPYSPDLDTTGDTLWHMECALRRTQKVMDKYGKKRVYITEIGWPTVPELKRECDLRTQGDYLIRSFIMGLDFGAEKIQWYCFYDLYSFLSGFDQTNAEYHFGTLYFPNFYGMVMPKPSGVAFANMTRMLDTVKTVDRQADPSATSRAYKAILADKSQVTIAWSNCARLANDTIKPEMREPTLPWENQWKKAENVSFAASGTKVVVTDSMGNATTYKVENGRVTIPLNGSPVFIAGLK